MLKQLQNNSDLISFIEQAPSAICMLDKEMKYLNASKKWLKDYGIVNQQVIGISHYEIFPEIGEEWKELHRRALAGETLKRDEDPFQRLDGTTQYLRWEMRPWYNESDEVGGLVMYTEDITNSVKQRELLENFFDISTELFCIFDFDGNFKKLNKVWSEILGYTKDELYSKKFFEFIHPEDLPIVYNTIEVLNLGENVFNFQVRFLTNNNETLIIKWNCNAKNGQINAIGTNITHEVENKKIIEESNLLLSNFFDISTELFCIVDYNGNFIKINDNWENLLGFTKDELMSKKFLDSLHPDDIQPTLDKMKLINNGEKLFDFHNRYITKDGNYKTINWKAVENGNYINAIGTDITNELDYKNEIKATKEILEETNKIAGIGYWEVDLVKGKIFWSKITKEIHGVEEDFDPNLNTAYNFYKEGYSRDKINEVVSIAIQTGKSFDIELEFINFQGQELWVRAIGNVEFKDGNAFRLYGTFQDINLRKSLEIELAEDRNRLNQILIGTNVGTWEWNVQTGETIFNERWANIIGYEIAEIEPIDINTWLKFTHPDDVENAKIELNRHFNGELDYYDVKFRMKHKKGNWVWVLAKGKVFSWTADGKPEMMYGTHQEITKEVELQSTISELNQSLISILDSATQVSIIVTDLNGTITHFNKGAENLLGYKAEEMIGLRTPAIIHVEEEVINRAIEINQKYNVKVEGFEVFVFKANKGEYDIREWTYVKKNGIHFSVQLIITAQKNSLGEIIGFIGVATDITKLKEYEIELINAKEKAEETSRAKSEFLANMSHEIRTPLNGVIGFTDLLMRSKLDDLQKQYMESVNKSAISLMDLINDILDFSKIESGKLELNIEKVDLYDLASQVVDVIKFKAHEKQLEILLDIDYSIGRFVYIDPVRIRQVLINLMGNAVKFTEKGEVSLSIKNVSSFYELDEFGNKINYIDLRFSVKDTGIGIDKSKFSQILEAFGQEDSSTTRKYGGTGLGLSITNNLLLLMDSNVKIASEIGIGSDFYFDLKVKAEDGNKEELVNETDYTNALVIDDNQYNRTIIKEMLKIIGIKCDEAENGIDGLKKINKYNYDIIIIDYNMPYMDGIEVIKNIREKLNLDDKKQPIIFLHSSSDNEVIDKACKQYNINYSMMKPIKLDWLIKSLNLIYRNKGKIKEKNDEVENFDLSYNDSSDKRRFKVLVVEDNDVNMLLVKSIFNLIMINCEIFEARNGFEAIEKTKSIIPDIIFMDVQMPTMNGYDSTREIRQLEVGANIPIIALTAGTVKGERERCLEAGMSDYITKPVVLNKIQEMLIKWLSGETIEANNLIGRETKSKSFDKIALFERLFQDEESYNMIIKVMTEFLNNEFPTEFLRAIKENDKNAYDFIVHKLKGSSSTCCMTNLFNFAVALEKVENIQNEKFEELKKNLLDEIDLCIVLLNEKLN